MNVNGARDIRLFSTCPASRGEQPRSYFERVKKIARWCDAAGYVGILVYTDNGLVDPWLVSQLILQETESLAPLVAVQPVYMHPYTVAKMTASLAFLHGRRIFLNMVAGGFRNDLLALDDDTEHDARYDRLVEYTQIIKGLLGAPEPFAFKGRYYTINNLKLTPPLPPELFPGITVSGSSSAGLEAARTIGATAVRYPQPPSAENGRLPTESIGFGMRIGVITRETDEEAWDVAFARFPTDRTGTMTHKLAMTVSDSRWHRQLSELGQEDVRTGASPYWLGPFENYKTFCPYLVGSYSVVGQEIRRYLDLGFGTFILDIPPSQEELSHIGVAFDRGRALVAA
jgi:alkanesulfonate monooxygenase